MASDPMPALLFGSRGEFWRACALLVLAQGDHHGYELVAEMTDRGYGEPDPAGLYRALRDLEDDGLVTSSWVPGDHRPARRTYAITDQGLAALDDSAAAARAARRRLDRMLAHHRRMPRPNTSKRSPPPHSSRGTAPSTAKERRSRSPTPSERSTRTDDTSPRAPDLTGDSELRR